ncbi:hypothetical protein QWZ08_25825 [Ferruginibacter paludis]|uniref:hypothetical protein n=1 Tax=Ferruginibacter paludis TaxID=1310417 RepID=UPI0025B465E6|nr:hypothetical protein [Ferruginibacter paludis]MDN3659090.1 hypothetical protein [Ferruginibacter paludis]
MPTGFDLYIGQQRGRIGAKLANSPTLIAKKYWIMRNIIKTLKIRSLAFSEEKN